MKITDERDVKGFSIFTFFVFAFFSMKSFGACNKDEMGTVRSKISAFLGTQTPDTIKTDLVNDFSGFDLAKPLPAVKCKYLYKNKDGLYANQGAFPDYDGRALVSLVGAKNVTFVAGVGTVGNVALELLMKNAVYPCEVIRITGVVNNYNNQPETYPQGGLAGRAAAIGQCRKTAASSIDYPACVRVMSIVQGGEVALQAANTVEANINSMQQQNTSSQLQQSVSTDDTQDLSGDLLRARKMS